MADHWRTSRRAVGGIDQLGGSPRGAGVGAELIPFPSGSVIAPDHSFESVDVTQTLFNVASVLDAIFIVLVTTAAFVIGPFLLLFCEFR